MGGIILMKNMLTTSPSTIVHVSCRVNKYWKSKIRPTFAQRIQYEIPDIFLFQILHSDAFIEDHEFT